MAARHDYPGVRPPIRKRAFHSRYQANAPIENKSASQQVQEFFGQRAISYIVVVASH